MPITARPDHVAVAVPSIEAASRRWIDELGAVWLRPPFDSAETGFGARQARFPSGAKLELLEPRGEDSFVGHFLARRGAGVHHVTLSVPDLLGAVAIVREAGYDVVDVSAEGDHWHEGFLRPSQVGGMIVQLAWIGYREPDGPVSPPSGPPEGAPVPRLLGPRLAHPDLAVAASLWELLGATVTRGDDRLHVGWPDAPLDIEVVRGETPGPLGLRFADAPERPGDEVVGAAILPAT